MDHKIIQIIKNQIDETGISKIELSEKSGLPYHHIKRILKEERTASINQMEALLNVFDLKIDSYVGHKNDPHFELLKMIKSLSFEGAQLLLKGINVIRNK